MISKEEKHKRRKFEAAMILIILVGGFFYYSLPELELVFSLDLIILTIILIVGFIIWYFYPKSKD